MRRIRIAIVGTSPCECCTAACCRQNGHEYSALLEGDEIRRFAPWSIDARIRAGDRVIIAKVLPYVNGRCIFLGDDDRCLVYDDRPNACRTFQCVAQFNRRGQAHHGEFLVRNPHVLAMLQRL